MIVFLYGQDGYRLKQNLNKVVLEYGKKNISGLSHIEINFGDNQIEALNNFNDAVKSVSFFNEKKLIIAKSIFSVADRALSIIKDRDLVGDKAIILVIAEEAGKTELNKQSKKLFNLCSSKPNVAKEFSPLSGKPLENWISKEIENYGISADAQIVKQLVLNGNDSWKLSQEIIKLANYAFGSGKKTIELVDLKLLVTNQLEQNIFNTIDALGNRDKAKTISLINRHLEAGADPYYLFSMFIYQFRNMLKVKSLNDKYMAGDAIAKKTGLHPYVVKKCLEQTRKFELNDLKQKFINLADSDIRIKNGEIDIVDCLYQIALS